MRLLVLLLAGMLLPGLACAADETACGQAIAAAERQHATPPKVLDTIAKVESGRPVGRRLIAWPWSINAEGVGHFYDNKAAAIEAVRSMQAAGLRSIDVGCMQINLAAHPQAFASLEDAFDPATNAQYAAAFLRSLTAETGRIGAAMTAYHSRTRVFAADYAKRLLAIWPGAAALGVAPAPAPPPPSAYTEAFAREIQTNRAGLARVAVPARASGLRNISSRGMNWPR